MLGGQQPWSASWIASPHCVQLADQRAARGAKRGENGVAPGPDQRVLESYAPSTAKQAVTPSDDEERAAKRSKVALPAELRHDEKIAPEIMSAPKFMSMP